jgi:G8 domain/Right handed beta helix region
VSWSETYNSGSNPIVISGGGPTNLWSDPATWGGAVPLATDVVTIAAGHTVYLDITTAVAASLDIQGSLIAVQTASVGLTTGNINVGAAGVFQVGSVATPYPAAYTATFTLNGAEVARTTRTVSGTNLGFTNNGVGRSIQVQPGGTLTMIGGNTPTYKRTKLNANAAAGTNTFTLMDSTGWLAGDDIVMGTTDFFGVSVPEKLTLTANASGTSIQTTTTIATSRWGALQYVTDTGMSLTAGTLTGAPAGVGTNPATATVLDERAMLINLRRNIIVQGANDSAWTSNKFGVHIMAMSGGSTPGAFVQPNMKLDGVRVIRCGQAGAIGRYPIHWHMCSYNMAGNYNAASPDGVFLGALTGNYVKNCAIEQSGQRMITIHGTHGITADNNVGFDITGHALFLEDGAEMNNFVTNNTVMKIRAPTSANTLILSDVAASDYSYAAPGVYTAEGTAGVWFTNPNNTLTGNWVNDSEGAGIWNTFALQCFGLSVNVALNPNSLPISTWADNAGCCNKGAGASTRFPVVDALGNTQDNSFLGNSVATPLFRLTSFKNWGGGYANRVKETKYVGFAFGDNAGMDVFGQVVVASSTGENFLHVAESLNNATSKYASSKKSGMATYHEVLNFKNSLMVGYGWQDGVMPNDSGSPIGGGLFRLNDLYIQGMFSFVLETGIKQINCAPPFRPLPPDLDGFPLAVASNPGYYRNWTLAGAIRDVNGVFVPAGHTWVYDKPFLTYGLSSSTPVAPSGSNGVHTPDRFYGVQTFTSDTYNTNATLFQGAIRVAQQDTSGAEQGVWQVANGLVSIQLNTMRNFAPRDGGRYRLSFPGGMSASFVSFEVSGMTGANDIFLLGVEFSGSSAISSVFASTTSTFTANNTSTNIKPIYPNGLVLASGEAKALTATGSLANVVADTTGNLYFQETSTNTVWMKVKLGGVASATNTTYITDPMVLYYLPVKVAIIT